MEPAASERPLVSFRRAYSCIEGLQPAYTVRYELFLEKKGYRLEVHQAGFCDGKASCPVTRVTAARAAELLRYLYENGVPAAQAAEAVQDVCGAIAWN